ncbi:alpha/beta hydrolase [Janthinobacterium agaricidamnosum]|uniref:Phospholipase/Carboxylesterase family protein n=1 Tax=Janthinobacterium agaricidamnosum NBRC 102515 = DSM 9628 TaxID=1349767 RepID=W0V5G5_9BURK|nr:PHB depolymerase family esterase [Janthinobacterium agaricidamnosum]CDG82492.1 phospholipase/Carboxylesterase family protein [Janthinobacterium agaricidamnosum NBRC 102515 = DSM 9628]
MKHTLQHLVSGPDWPLAHRLRAPGNGVLDGAPCVILLHGVGSNEVNLLAWAQEQDPSLAVILVRAPLVLGPDAYGWFHVTFGAAGPVINAGQAEVSRLALLDFIRGLPAAYGIDAERIWLAGFSQGGILSASVGLTQPGLLAGFGLLSGRILPEIDPAIAAPEALRTVSAFVSHGVQDSKLPIDFARKSHQLLTDKGVLHVYREYDAVHELNPAMRRDFGAWLAGAAARKP